ncbi:MAG: 50S ribosomal protein L19 [Tissierellia bacterium]|nr:50S ribosomal protein L19 [Tissierellia bacterium]
MDYIKNIEESQLRENKLDFNVGDTVQVDYRVKEGTRERIQVYEGTVIKKQGGGLNETFTVRRTAYGVGVERTFYTNSPRIEDVRVKRRGNARRSKLYYLRGRQGRAAKVREKQNY